MSQPALAVRQLIKDYGSLRAVNEVGFTAEPGEVLGLLGPNGAGKTSIISCIVTLEKPTSGSVAVFSHDVSEQPRQAKMLTGFVPQEIIHHGYFDVEEILEFHSGYFGRLRNKERIDYLLNRLGLWEHRKKKVKALSGGMKRRLLIAKALVHEPKLLLLDEPTAGVDIELRESLWEFVRELRKSGVTILLTTHYIQEAEELCDRVGILQKGELKALGKTRDLIKGLTKREIILQFNGDVPQFQHPCLIRFSNREAVFELPATQAIGDLLSSLSIDMKMIRDLQIREGSLEDALKHVLGGGK